MVKKSTGLPMKIDESAHDTASLLQAYELGCLDAVALKTVNSAALARCAKRVIFASIWGR